MKPPSSDTMLIGHPIVAGSVLLLTLGFIGAATQDSSMWAVALLMLWPVSRVIEASTRRKEYLNWKRAWDDMGDPHAGRRQ